MDNMEAKIEVAVLSAQEATQARLAGIQDSVKACITSVQRQPVRFTLACVGASMALLMLLGNGSMASTPHPHGARPPAHVAAALRGVGAMGVLAGGTRDPGWDDSVDNAAHDEAEAPQQLSEMDVANAENVPEEISPFSDFEDDAESKADYEAHDQMLKLLEEEALAGEERKNEAGDTEEQAQREEGQEAKEAGDTEEQAPLEEEEGAKEAENTEEQAPREAGEKEAENVEEQAPREEAPSEEEGAKEAENVEEQAPREEAGFVEEEVERGTVAPAGEATATADTQADDKESGSIGVPHTEQIPAEGKAEGTEAIVVTVTPSPAQQLLAEGEAKSGKANATEESNSTSGHRLLGKTAIGEVAAEAEGNPPEKVTESAADQPAVGTAKPDDVGVARGETSGSKEGPSLELPSAEPTSTRPPSAKPPLAQAAESSTNQTSPTPGKLEVAVAKAAEGSTNQTYPAAAKLDDVGVAKAEQPAAKAKPAEPSAPAPSTSAAAPTALATPPTTAAAAPAAAPAAAAAETSLSPPSSNTSTVAPTPAKTSTTAAAEVVAKELGASEA